MPNRPQTLVILAMTIDGKIADYQGNAARFASKTDKKHLETQIAGVDAVIFGTGTLQAYGTSLPITDPELIALREKQNKPLQPFHIVCSTRGNFDFSLPFFQQSIPRWLLTTNQGNQALKGGDRSHFQRIMVSDSTTFKSGKIHWSQALATLSHLRIEKLAVLGGEKLVTSLLELNLIDELFFTICPVILGGKSSPTPVAGRGLLEESATKLSLLTAEVVGEEIFLHYRVNQ